jgi:hypothetical protein
MLAAPAKHVDPKKAAIEKVKAQLKDPDSAKFRDIKPLDDKGSVCGWVNAKNSYGGYTGFSVFFVSNDGKAVILPPDLSEEKLC